MLQEVLLPQLGQTMEEGTVERWHKAEGDEVGQGEILFELTTDKATLEVESFASGVVKKILVDEGDTVPVNELIAIIGDEEDEVPEDLDAFRTEIAESGPAPEEVSEGQGEQDVPGEEAAVAETDRPAPAPRRAGRIFASPRARKLAEEQKVPLSVLRGSGPEGRVIERDVQDYLAELDDIRSTPTAREVAFQEGVDLRKITPDEEGGRITEEAVREAASAAPQAGQRMELSPMRQTIAERMSTAKQNVPHFYLMGQVNMREAMARRRELNESSEVKITVTDLLVRAAGLALKEHPRMNARFEGDSIALNERANIGVAVAVEDGLFVPVIRDADCRPIGELSSDLKSLAELARNGELKPEQYEGGSLTISNLGTYGVDYFMPIINEPESCILGIGEVSEEVVAEDGAIRIEPMMKVSLSGDHRVVDGALAAEFFATFRGLLEAPESL